MNKFQVCERTIKYYQSTINYVILAKKDLMLFCENGIIYCAVVKAIK